MILSIILIITVLIGISSLVGFGGLVFNDAKRDKGITLFSGIFGGCCVLLPFLYLLEKVN